MVRGRFRLPVAPLVTTFAALLLFATFAVTAAQRPVQEQLSTAARYAGYAAQSSNLGGVHAHLQHVINCLEGPGGTAYDSASFDPCGPLRERAALLEESAPEAAPVREVLRFARSGRRMDSLPAARGAAEQARDLLQGLEAQVAAQTRPVSSG